MSWITTFTGRKWHLMEPREEDVHISDIAHALSLTCRYGGHCKEFYSVAQHCVIMSDVLLAKEGRDVAMWALLHDCAEAYLGDVVRPLKHSLPDYKKLERRTEAVILRGLCVPHPSKSTWEIVKHYDNVMLMTERRDLINHNGEPWECDAIPLPGIIDPVSALVAEDQFLARFDLLLGDTM